MLLIYITKVYHIIQLNLGPQHPLVIAIQYKGINILIAAVVSSILIIVHKYILAID